MRASWLLVSALLLGLAAAPARAAPAVPVLHQHVTDQTGTLTPDQVAQLEASLVALEQRKGSQLAVLMVATTGEQSLEAYSLAVAEAARLGRAKVDDGVLLLIAKDDRKARIEVGYGLEGVVTDALSSRVIREYLAPKFRANDYFGGIHDAVGVLSKLVEGEALPTPMAAEPRADSPNLMLSAFIGFFIGMIASGTRLKPLLLRRLGAGGIAAGIAWFVLAAGFTSIVAALVAFLVSSAGGGRFGSGRGHWGSFPAGAGGWGGGSSGGGGWSGGGGSFGGGGASGGW